MPPGVLALLLGLGAAAADAPNECLPLKGALCILPLLLLLPNECLPVKGDLCILLLLPVECLHLCILLSACTRQEARCQEAPALDVAQLAARNKDHHITASSRGVAGSG